MKNKNVQKILFLVAVLLLPLIVWLKASARPGEVGLTWSIGASPVICLSVGDKYAYLGHYNALFVIKDSKGHRSQKVISVDGRDPGRVYYSESALCSFVLPEDWVNTGNHSWVCIVNNEVVASGKFSDTYIGNGEQIRISPTHY